MPLRVATVTQQLPVLIQQAHIRIRKRRPSMVYRNSQHLLHRELIIHVIGRLPLIPVRIPRSRITDIGERKALVMRSQINGHLKRIPRSINHRPRKGSSKAPITCPIRNHIICSRHEQWNMDTSTFRIAASATARIVIIEVQHPLPVGREHLQVRVRYRRTAGSYTYPHRLGNGKTVVHLLARLFRLFATREVGSAPRIGIGKVGKTAAHLYRIGEVTAHRRESAAKVEAEPGTSKAPSPSVDIILPRRKLHLPGIAVPAIGYTDSIPGGIHQAGLRIIIFIPDTSLP